MSRLSNRVSKLESVNGIVDMEQLQRNNPDVDLSALSQKHLLRFAEMQRDTAPGSLASFSMKELQDSLAFSILFTAHAKDDQAIVTRAIAALDDGQKFTTDELQSLI